MEPYSSPVPHLLQTNDPVHHPAAKAAIRGLVDRAERDLSRLDDDIDRVEADVQLLRRDRDQVRSFLSEHKRVLSPVRSLPREIIAEIVLHALDHYTDAPTFVTLDTRSTPWAFGRICSTWRDVVLTLPRIWTFLEIAPEDLSDKLNDMSDAEDITDVALQRSRGHPLSITFKDSFSPEVSLRLMKLVMQQCHRWKEVNFELDISHLHDLNEVEGKLPCLESLILVVNEDPSDLDGPVDAFKIAPRLRRISITLPREIALSFPWTQLTYYKEEDWPVPNRVQVIPQLSNLVHCILDTTYVYFIPTTHICLPRLRTLVCAARDLDHFTLPSLQSLRIHFVGDYTSLYSLIDRSCCSLKSLSISGWGFEGSLRNIPTLNSLYLALPYDPDFIDSLTIGVPSDSSSFPSDSSSFPQLQSFMFDIISDGNYDEPYLDDIRLVEMVESRSVASPEHGIACLATFYFSSTCPISSEVIERFKTLGEGGMKLFVEAREEQVSYQSNPIFLENRIGYETD